MANNDITMLDLPPAPSISGTESVWIVQGGTDRRTTIAAIAGLPASLVLQTTVVQSGSTYNALPTDTLIIIEKTVGSPTSVLLPLSAQKSGFYYIKDGKGDAGTNAITVTFSGGQLADGNSSVQIAINYGGVQFAPNPLGGWVIANFG